MEFLIDFILHIDKHLIEIVQDYHTWAYAILFMIIFCETVEDMKRIVFEQHVENPYFKVTMPQ